MLKKLFTTLLPVLMLASTAQAGLQGSALLALSDIKIVRVSDDQVISGTFDVNTTELDAGGPFVRVSSALTNSISEVTRGGVTEEVLGTFQISSANGGGSIVSTSGSFGPAYIGTNASPADNDFTIQAADYVRADSAFGGSFVDIVEPNLGGGILNIAGLPPIGPTPLVPVPPTGGFGTTYADFNVGSLDGPVTAGSANIVNNSSQIRFQANSNETVRLDFTATSDLFLAHTGTPNLGGTASTSLQVTINEVFNGGSNFLGPVFPELNQSISLSPNGAGPSTYTFSDDLSSVEFDLNVGSTYEITINQKSAIAVVPEPSSAIIFSVLAAVPCLMRRRKS
ncbi:hypothetical protein SV7mr_28690 [Stieleria bergensis]|uniref:PEP-CTERM protein-sorting domain-containing protein n=1 Tax=Stieleria bergensis TaxID=2528025 RepID=A0A517SW39_9BACT|nr:hypothetical protein SV7mr_28690 [Planctomycetes bacterium SV_7m_r]